MNKTGIKKAVASLAAFGGLLLAGQANAAVIVTVEAPGVQNTTITLLTKGIETFDSFDTGFKDPLVAPFGGGALSGTYNSTLVFAANLYGGAGGVGNYNVVQSTSSLTVSGGPTNYFGLWATALDGGNTVAFYKGGINVGSVNLTDYALTSSYLANPTEPYEGGNGGEHYAFFNFVVDGGFDRVDLIENGGGGFESDNHTLGLTGAVPEPGTWMLMITGIGLVGAGLRRSSRAPKAPFA